jgi:hypothetical protein
MNYGGNYGGMPMNDQNGMFTGMNEQSNNVDPNSVNLNSNNLGGNPGYYGSQGGQSNSQNSNSYVNK